jgi:hypothetical protein
MNKKEKTAEARANDLVARKIVTLHEQIGLSLGS